MFLALSLSGASLQGASTTIIDSLNNPFAGSTIVFSGEADGQAFTTSGTTYDLDSIEVSLGQFNGQTATINIELRADNNGSPASGTPLMTWTGISVQNIAEYQVTEDSQDGLILQPNTQYWVVVHCTNLDVDWFTTTTQSEPGVGTLGDLKWGDYPNFNNTESGEYHFMRVIGTEVSNPELAVSAASANKSEGDSGSTSFTFTVDRTVNTGVSTSFDYAISGNGGNPAAAADFGGSFPSGSMTFTSGQTSKTITVNVSGDSTVELNEGFKVTISNASGGATISQATATGTIQNDDSAQVSVSGVSMSEGNSGTQTFNFSVSISNPVDTTVTARADTANGTATASGDYTAVANQTVTFSANSTASKTVSVTVTGDTVIEPNEMFAVNLSNLQASSRNVSFGTSSANGTIQNDDSGDFGDAPDTGAGIGTGNYETLLANDGPRHSIGGPRLGSQVDSESDGQPASTALTDDNTGGTDDEDGVQLPANFFQGSSQPITVTVGNATGRVDGWIDWNRNGQFGDNANEKVINNMQLGTGMHEITVNVPGGASAGDSYARFRISTAGGHQPTGYATDGEVEDYKVAIAQAPTHSIAASSADKAEGDSGITAYTFTVTRTVNTAVTSRVNYAVAGNTGNPAAAADFQGGVLASGQLTFNPADTTKTITVNVNGDTTPEPDEGFSVTLSLVDGEGALGTAAAPGVIRDDDTDAPMITDQPDGVGATVGDNVTFTVTATGTAPLAYQWKKDGAPIGGANSSSFTLNSVQTSDAATYTVTVSNSAGMVTSSGAVLTVAVPPTITGQPFDAESTLGGVSGFDVVAEGGGLSYQWFKDGEPISGATNPGYLILETAESDAGVYTVVVSNAAGSVTSDPATLSILYPVAITTQPVSQVIALGLPVTFTVEFTGSDPLAIQWQKDGVNINGATSASYTIAEVEQSDAGDYTVMVSNPYGASGPSMDTSDAATLTVSLSPVITSQPQSKSVVRGGKASFQVVAGGPPPLSYQWKKDGVNIPGATLPGLTLTSVEPSDAGAYTVTVSNSSGMTTSMAANLTVIVPPSITLQPQAQTVLAGNAATLSVTATGTAPLSYQWHRNGSPVAGANAAQLMIANPLAANAGSYSVVVSNAGGSVTSSPAVLTVNVPPSIGTQPQNTAVLAGQNAQLSVTAGGSAPLAYQWLKNGNPIPGANGPILEILNASASNAATYSARVSNPLGTATSMGANLTVNFPPSIATQPASQRVLAGGTATFSVEAGGTAPLTYQWLKDGANVAGATSSALTINDVQMANLGNYSVRVMNTFGNVTSDAVALLISRIPIITGQPQSQAAAIGGSVTFNVTATGDGALTYQWMKDGVDIPGATSAAFTIGSVASADQGSYSVAVANANGRTVSQTALLTLQDPPLIVSQPRDVEAARGSTVRFSVRATGAAPLSYQWRRDGFDLAGATSSRLVVENVQMAGNYSVTVRNGSGEATSDAASLTIVDPPQITGHPVSTMVFLPGMLNLNVSASPFEGLNYQWLRNGVAIPGATSSNYTVAEAQESDTGIYTVRVSNAAGSVTSDAAAVTVGRLPFITKPPVSRTVMAGTRVTFRVEVEGTGPLAYQWKFQGVPIPGATGADYTVDSATMENEGSYEVEVSNALGNTLASAQLALTTMERKVRIVSGTASSGGSIALPVEVDAMGNEHELAFSVRFDPSLLLTPQVTLGPDASGANLVVEESRRDGGGKLGIKLTLPSGNSLFLGTRHVLNLGFTQGPATEALQLPVTFEDQPTPRVVSDTVEVPLDSTYVNGLVTLSTGIEGDVAPVGSGDGAVDASDVQQSGRYVLGLDAAPVDSEFQRADCAPLATLGDGALTLADWIQTLRYSQGADSLSLAGGPGSGASQQQAGSGSGQPALQGLSRELKIGSGVVFPGSTLEVPVLLQAQGDEFAASFTLEFDPTHLTYVETVAGADAAGATLMLNESQTEAGRVGVLFSLPFGQSLAAGARQIVVVRLSVSASAGSGQAFQLTDSMVNREVVNSLAEPLTIATSNGSFPLQLNEFRFDPVTPASLMSTGFPLTVTAGPGITVRIDWSDDLIAWTMLTTLAGNGAVQQFVDEAAKLEPKRYYRVVIP